MVLIAISTNVRLSPASSCYFGKCDIVSVCNCDIMWLWDGVVKIVLLCTIVAWNCEKMSKREFLAYFGSFWDGQLMKPFDHMAFCSIVPLWHCDIVLYSSALWHCFPLSKLSKSESVACRGSSWDVLMSLKYRLLPIKRTRSISLSDDRQTAFVWTFLDINWQLQLLLCHKWMLFVTNRFCWKANKRFPIFVQFIWIL